MRKLQTRDLFAFSRCIRKMGVKDEIKAAALNAENKNVSDMGFDILYKLFELATNEQSENEVYLFLSGPLEEPPEKIKEMDLDKLFLSVGQLADFSTWKAFFTKAVH